MPHRSPLVAAFVLIAAHLFQQSPGAAIGSAVGKATFDTSSDANVLGPATHFSGGCYCKPQYFKTRYRASSNVVRVYVLKIQERRDLMRNPNNRANIILVYTLAVTKLFKGKWPALHDRFKAQAFENVNYCGVKLILGRSYLLYMDSRSKISRAGHWNPNWFLLNACQTHWRWDHVGSKQRAFLAQRAVHL